MSEDSFAYESSIYGWTYQALQNTRDALQVLRVHAPASPSNMRAEQLLTSAESFLRQALETFEAG